MIRIETKNADITTIEADLIIVNLFQDVTEPAGATGSIDKALNGAITNLIEIGDLRGKLGEIVVLYTQGALTAPRVMIVGLGQAEKFNTEVIREVSASAIKKVNALGVAKVATIVHGGGIDGVDIEVATQAMVEGSLLALYKYDAPRAKKSEESHPLESFTVVEFDADKMDGLSTGAKAGQIIAESVYLARTLTNQPSNLATPTHIANTAAEMCADVGLSCQILDEDEMKAEEMNALLAVAQGTAEPSKFVIMEHKPESAGQPIILVGKGVSFDTGGYTLKTAKGMPGMKVDMAGAAAVIGAMRAVALLNLPLHVIGLVPSVENMVDSRAYKPDDVFIAKNGVSIEIVSTDAEGRMLLADALCYADKFDPAVVIDVATLTGGKVVALGERTSALFCDDDTLYNALFTAGQRVNEPMWRMPLDPAYDRQLKSEYADIRNSGGRYGHAILGGRFLAHFVGDWAWAHIDIAGDASYHGGDTQTPRSYMTKGGTGTPLRAIVECLRHWGR